MSNDPALDRDIQRTIALLQSGQDPNAVLRAFAANVQTRMLPAGGGTSRCQGCGASNALCPTCYAKMKAGGVAIDFLKGLAGGGAPPGPPVQGPAGGVAPQGFMPREAAPGMRYAEPPVGPTYEDLHRPANVPPPPPGPQTF
jgi:ferredoxin